ncbi:hypothetical protein [Methanoregula sp.]|uniref:hypothetical protein n=1 Tax=Methanoregula sp. TaxID=2052170 RepID=UPI003565CF5F
MAYSGKRIFAAVFGILYLAFGSVMIGSVIPALDGLTGQAGIPSDPAAGFVLCVIGAVFLFAYRELSRTSADGPAFLIIGMVLSVVFAAVALLSLGVQGTGILLFGEGETWDPIRLLVPMLYLGIGPAAGLFVWGRAFLSDLAGA